MAFSFAIKYKGQLLDIEDNSHLTVDWFSTLFNEADLFKGSYAYAVKLKLSEKNKSLLGLPHLIENRSSRSPKAVSILLFGRTWKNAVLEINIENKFISGNLLVDHAIVADFIKETSLPNLFSTLTGEQKIYDGIDIGSTFSERQSYISNTNNQSIKVQSMAFPSFKNYGWSGEYLNDDSIKINWVSSTLGNYNFSNPKSLFCPMFYFHWLIKTVCEKMGFQAVGSFMENYEFSKWIIYNNSYYTSKEIQSDNFRIYPSRHLPDITIVQLLKTLRNDLLLGIHFDSLSRMAYFELPNNLIESSNFIKLGDFLIKDSLKLKTGAIKRFTIKGFIDDGDLINSSFESIDSFTIGDGETSNKRELGISSLRMGYGYKDRFEKWHYRVPIADQVANIYDVDFMDFPAYNRIGENNINSFGLRVLSFRGNKRYSNEVAFGFIPYATSDNRNALNEIQESWISPDPFHEKGWLRIICEKMYQLLIYSDDLEFDILCPIHKFMDINPLIKSQIITKNGAKQTFLWDKITFEPSKRNKFIYARIKAIGVQKGYLLSHIPLNFTISNFTKVEDVIFVFASVLHVRDENRDGGIVSFGKVFLEFFSDKYRVNTKIVNNLVVKVEAHAYFKLFEGTNPDAQVMESIKELSITTGGNVIDHLDSLEFEYKSTIPMLKMEMELKLIENPDNPYFFI